MATASAPSKPEAPFEFEMHDCVFTAEGACTEAPLTSEPPLPDTEPLTSEPPLADAAPLTSETAVWDMGADTGMDTGMDLDISVMRP
ncbi:hypothetical protein SZN_30072 [Streptomyces zinciresistens K42]|uniref:Uncharacterized protein n=1 Tax=Streptomyces zinciresistens K42 TaxID=700597 RepID=G2GKH1_9ACTN|nr:hypothetical protein [Streptomyces zinciresistens]EGX55993.1 hypothetical protein SZN_30072 [Streptomyces zinciresistens K42]